MIYETEKGHSLKEALSNVEKKFIKNSVNCSSYIFFKLKNICVYFDTKYRKTSLL